MGAYGTCHAISNKGYDHAIVGADEKFRTVSEIPPVELDKAWHAIHFLLTGDTRMTLLLSGTQVPGVCEHCEVHRAESIRDLYATINGRTVDELLAAFDVKIFDDLKIYPGPEWSEIGSSFIRPFLKDFVDFLKSLTDRNLGLMVVIC